MTRTAALLLGLALAGCGTPAGDVAAPPTAATGTTDLAPVSCPATFPAPDDRPAEPWVPAPPTTETPGRLVPDADPVSAVVCRYDPGAFPEPGDAAAPLVGEVALTAGLDRVRHDLLLPARLSGQDRACTLIGSALVPHLVRLDYADGSLWVSALRDANSCTDSGNGAFVTGAYLGEQLSRSYDSAAWATPPEPPAGSCLSGGRGRAGQERAVVPDGWTSMTACRSAGEDGAPPAPAVALDRAVGEQVVRVLDEVVTRPGGGTCDGPYDEAYDLLVTYPEGPPVQVAFSPGCVPSVRNGSLDGEPTADQTARLRSLLAP